MATQVIRIRGVTAVHHPGLRPRSLAALEPALLALVRGIALVVLLVLGLCGMAATTSWAADTMPPDGPAAGLDL